MTRLLKWMFVLALLALAPLTMAACGDDDEDEPAQQSNVQKFPASTTMGRIQEKGELVIGVKYDVPPFGFKNPQTGDIEGFDVDMARPSPRPSESGRSSSRRSPTTASRS